MVYLIYFISLRRLYCLSLLLFTQRNIPIVSFHCGWVLSAHSQLNQNEQEGEPYFSDEPHP